MAAGIGGEEMGRRASSSRRSSEIWYSPGDVFSGSGRMEEEEDEEVRWAAMERLPTYDRMRKVILRQVLENGSVINEERKATDLGFRERKRLIESMLKVIEEDNEKFLRRIRERSDR